MGNPAYSVYNLGMGVKAVPQPLKRTRVVSTTAQPDLLAAWKSMLIGQDHAIEKIEPYISVYKSGLNPPNRPAGVFLLLGPTGCGKSRTAETLAELLHGSEKKLLRVDCGEFQGDHEVAKVIGAPPGYLGHRETAPIFSAPSLRAVASDGCALSIVLFDEIEKSAPALRRVMMGILDKAVLKLGDNTIVDFENTLIFMTANSGSREQLKALFPKFGLSTTAASQSQSASQALSAAKKGFAPEFVNRIDEILVYQMLSQSDMDRILSLEISKIAQYIASRKGLAALKMSLEPAVRQFLMPPGETAQYGARELRRAILRSILHPLSREIQSLDGSVSEIRVVMADQSRLGFEYLA